MALPHFYTVLPALSTSDCPLHPPSLSSLSARKSHHLCILPSCWLFSFFLHQSRQCVFTQCTNIPQQFTKNSCQNPVSYRDGSSQWRRLWEVMISKVYPSYILFVFLEETPSSFPPCKKTCLWGSEPVLSTISASTWTLGFQISGLKEIQVYDLRATSFFIVCFSYINRLRLYTINKWNCI